MQVVHEVVQEVIRVPFFKEFSLVRETDFG